VMGAAIGAPLAPRDLGGSLAIVQQPADLTLEENHIATFAVQVSNPFNLPVSYQWSRSGSPIPGATGPSYSFQVTSGDSGATFSVQAAKIGSATNSRTASLTVQPDTHPPHLLSVSSSYTNLTTLVLRFD